MDISISDLTLTHGVVCSPSCAVIDFGEHDVFYQ
jgi:hypothetical protein